MLRSYLSTRAPAETTASHVQASCIDDELLYGSGCVEIHLNTLNELARANTVTVHRLKC